MSPFLNRVMGPPSSALWERWKAFLFFKAAVGIRVVSGFPSEASVSTRLSFLSFFGPFFLSLRRTPVFHKKFAPADSSSDASCFSRPTASPVLQQWRVPLGTLASPSIGGLPLATGDSRAAPTSVSRTARWPASPPDSLRAPLAARAPRFPASAARDLGTRWSCSHAALRTPTLCPGQARSNDLALRVGTSGCHSAPPSRR